MISCIKEETNYDLKLKDKSSKGTLIRNKNFSELISLIEYSVPHKLLRHHPETLYLLYRCLFLNLTKEGKLKTAEEIYEKFLYPVYLNYAIKIHSNNLKTNNHNMNINEKIEACIEKIIKLISMAKNYESEEEEEMMEMEKDIDVELLHDEIINNIYLSSSDSEINELEDDLKIFKKDQGKRIFEVLKCEHVIDKHTCDIIKNSQNNQIFNPISNINFDNFNSFEINKNINYSNNQNLNYNQNSINNNHNNNELKEENNKVNDEKMLNKNINYEKENNKSNLNFKDDPNSIYNKFNNKLFYKNNDSCCSNDKCNKKKKSKLRDRNPFLKTFKPKFLKRENIDKKIFRRFRNYLLYLIRKKGIEFFDNLDKEFYTMFFEKNLLPPIKISEPTTGKNYDFKSFNTKYFIWLFRKKGMIELYNEFVKEEGENLLNSFTIEYHLENSDEIDILEKLKTYIFSIPQFYYNMNNNNNSNYNDLKLKCWEKDTNERQSNEVDTFDDQFMEVESVKHSNVFNINFNFNNEDELNNNYCNNSNLNSDYNEDKNDVDNFNENLNNNVIFNKKTFFEDDENFYLLKSLIN